MAIRKWILPKLDTEVAATIAEECEINPFLALLLTTRGIKTADDAFAFLLGNDADDPFSFTDMDAAVERIGRAVDEGEKIMVYGDYDVDGITATALLYSYLKAQGADVSYRLPTREGDGYGLHKGVIDEFAAQDVSLVVTVDNGITANDEVEYAAEKGIDVVITDHHQPQDTLPNAVAVVDPHRTDCQSGCINYAGVGVAYMLVCALDGDSDAVMEKYGDLVALGTLADVMPLTGTTRSLVRNGLQVMNHLRRPGLKALAEISGMLDKELTASRVVFTLAPRLNAAGRMHDPLIAVQLLLESDYDTARTLAEKIQACNVERQTVESSILKQIEQRVRENPCETAARVLVVEGEDWPVGVIGILAARLTERYGKPAVVLSVKDGIAKGSGRSISGFSLFDAFSAVSDTAITFGGHELAAGITLKAENVAEFKERINTYAAQRFEEMPIAELKLDIKLRPSGIDVEKLMLLSLLEPLGAGNPVPQFGLFGMRLDNITPIGNGKHLRLSFSKGDARLSVLKFNTTYAEFPLTCGDVFDLVVMLEKNVYKGVITPTILLKDIRYIDTDEAELIAAQRRFEAIMRRETRDEGEKILPTREQMAELYRFLTKRTAFVGTLEQMHHLLNDADFPLLTMRLLLEIWREAKLINIDDFGDTLHISLLPSAEKRDLTATALWQFLKEQ